jgi:lipoyl(octanoyl) transferase
MTFEHFYDGRFCAVGNMARDMLLLESYPRQGALRLRHYDWEPDCFTFGYSQIYEWIKGQAVNGAQLARRPTGGGLVDHRHDWTYALAIPPEHKFYHADALAVYRIVHEAVADAMVSLGRPATLQPKDDGPDDRPLIFPAAAPKRVRGLCFAGAETFDVIDPVSRKKIAGAAMKRNRNGLLMQGSIDKTVAGELDWQAFGESFARELGVSFRAGATATVAPPSYPPEELAGYVARLGSEAWNKRR